VAQGIAEILQRSAKTTPVVQQRRPPRVSGAGQINTPNIGKRRRLAVELKRLRIRHAENQNPDRIRRRPNP